MPELTSDQIHFLWFAIGFLLGQFCGVGYMVSMKATQIIKGL